MYNITFSAPATINYSYNFTLIIIWNCYIYRVYFIYLHFHNCFNLYKGSNVILARTFEVFYPTNCCAERQKFCSSFSFLFLFWTVFIQLLTDLFATVHLYSQYRKLRGLRLEIRFREDVQIRISTLYQIPGNVSWTRSTLPTSPIST